MADGHRRSKVHDKTKNRVPIYKINWNFVTAERIRQGSNFSYVMQIQQKNWKISKVNIAGEVWTRMND